MQEASNNRVVFPRLIFGYATIGLVTVLAAWFSINRIENQVNAAPIVYEQALFNLRKIESLSNDAAEELFAYLLSGGEEELKEYRQVVETLPSHFNTFASSAMLSTPGEEPQQAKFLAIKRTWKSFTINAEIIIDEYQKSGVVALADFTIVEKSFDQYQELVNLLIEYEHGKALDAQLQLKQIIGYSQLLLIIVAGVALAALTSVGVLVTRQVNGFASRLQESQEYRSLTQVKSERLAAELTQFIDTANAPIFGIDADGLINEWNQTAAKITGFEKEDVLGQDLVQGFITEEYRESVKAVLDNALKGVESSNYEFPLYTKNGDRVEVLLNATTRLDVDRNIIGVIGVGQDITDAKVAQVKSERLAAELTQFIDTANAPIFGIDADGLINEWNQTAAKITGFEKEDVLGQDLVQGFITEEYRESVKAVLDNALKGVESSNYEFPLYTKNGDRVEVLLNATTRLDVDRNIIGVIGVGQDITDAKVAQVKSERLAAELTQFIDTANAPIFGIDADGLINEWNQTAAKITGFEKEDVLGQDLVQGFITEEYRESVKAVLDNALKGVESSNYEFPLYTKNGDRVEVLLNATTRRDVNGNIIGVIGVGQDITDAKVAQTALQQAQKMEVVGQLTGGLAHDFNNLLTVISGNLNFLIDELDVVSTDVAEIIDDAQSAAKDGAELTHRLLAFARQQVLEPQETLVNDLILDTSRLMGRTLGEDIRISTALASENPVVMVDQGQLESALMNLCINSRDAMPIRRLSGNYFRNHID